MGISHQKPLTLISNVIARPLQELKLLNMSSIVLHSLYIEKSVREFMKDTTEYQKRFFCKIYQKNPYNVHMNFVGDFDYIANTGQILSIFLEMSYRNRDLEAQILIYMMQDMQNEKASRIWHIQKKEIAQCDGGSVFYSKLWFFQYKPYHVHHTVVEGGYAMDIPEDIRTLVLPAGIGLY